MTAKEARQKAKKPSNGKSEAQYQDVMNAIENAVAKGEMSTFYYKELLVNVAASLKEDGYKIKQETDRDGLLVTISW